MKMEHIGRKEAENEVRLTKKQIKACAKAIIDKFDGCAFSQPCWLLCLARFNGHKSVVSHICCRRQPLLPPAPGVLGDIPIEPIIVSRTEHECVDSDGALYAHPQAEDNQPKSHGHVGQKTGEGFNDWLNDGFRLKPVRSNLRRVRCVVDALFAEIATLVKVSSKSRQKEAVKVILLNLRQARNLDCKVRYSRDKNWYTRARRYGMLFFKYDRIIRAIDAMAQLGYIEQKRGCHPHDGSQGCQSRMWGTAKLWALCNKHRLGHSHFPIVPDPSKEEEIIILRTDKDKEIGYRENRETREMREDLERYNALVDKHKISVCLTGETIVGNRWLVEDLYASIQHGITWIHSAKLNGNHRNHGFETPVPGFTTHKKPYPINPATIHHKVWDKVRPVSSPTSITHTKLRIALLRGLLRRFWSEPCFVEKDLEKRYCEIRQLDKDSREEALDHEFRLRDIGIDELVLMLDQERLHRVFNRSSWKFGGRAYGALHQSMLRKAMREDILIDGQPTIEIDFSAYHALMLYHLAGIDYPEDPYEACEGPAMRKVYKVVCLIGINAKCTWHAIHPIRRKLFKVRDKLIKEGRPVPIPDIIDDEDLWKGYVEGLIEKFRQSHPAIVHRLFSDAGVTLMNIDSKIMNAILVRLMDHGILGLSVYDSVIVAEQYADVLRDIMVAEYKEVMGFNPMF